MPTSYKKCPNPECDGSRHNIGFEVDPRCVTTHHGEVVCEWCGMLGPTGKGNQEAKKLWNNLPRY